MFPNVGIQFEWHINSRIERITVKEEEYEERVSWNLNNIYANWVH